MAHRSAGNRRKSGPGWALTSDEDRRTAGTTGGGGSRSVREGPPIARLRLEKRRGRPVTVCVLEGVTEDDARAHARDLRELCGTGGTSRGGEFELQGDHRERVREFLSRRGLGVRG